MARNNLGPDDERATRTLRPRTPTDRLPRADEEEAEPLRQDWRSSRTTRSNRRSHAVPTSRQEFIWWMQRGGWKVLLTVASVVILAIVGLILLRPRPLAISNNDTNSGTDSNSGIIISTLQPTVTPAPVTPTTEAAATGAQFQVYNTESQGLFLRSDPNTTASVVKTLPEGTIVTIIGEDVSGSDYVWKHVRDAEGAEGYVARDFLQAVQ